VTYQLLDTDSGNILGIFPTAADAVQVIWDELAAGGMVDNLAVVVWHGVEPTVVWHWLPQDDPEPVR
jgi:hypothetical protein